VTNSYNEICKIEVREEYFELPSVLCPACKLENELAIQDEERKGKGKDKAK
jgi:hypothetical protein